MTNRHLIQSLVYIENASEAFNYIEKKIIQQLIHDTAKKLFKEICKELSVCHVCGKKLKHNGKLAIKKYMANDYITITANVCPDDTCVYNTELVIEHTKIFNKVK